MGRVRRGLRRALFWVLGQTGATGLVVASDATEEVFVTMREEWMGAIDEEALSCGKASIANAATLPDPGTDLTITI